MISDFAHAIAFVAVSLPLAWAIGQCATRLGALLSRTKKP